MNFSKRKILIVSYYYEPENTPRAFRTKELVTELSNRNYSIDLFIPEQNIDKINEYPNNVNITGVKSRKANINNNKNEKSKILNLINRVKNKILNFATGDINGFLFGNNLYKTLISRVKNEDYDAIISIGLPFYNHLATARFIKKTEQQGIHICEYGDPFYFNPQHSMPLYIKYIEKWGTGQFDYISIPTAQSIEYFMHLKPLENIKIIPQGFDLSAISISEYKANKIPTFCYAGIFYKNIRNPQPFFEMLTKINIPFIFVVYTDLNDKFSNDICSHYKNILGDKIIIRNFIPRLELIEIISGMDFLINFDNTNSNQVPSKLIDYSLSERPILNIDLTSNDTTNFLKFLKQDYTNKVEINVLDYDIKNVVNSFEELITSEDINSTERC